MGLSRQEYWSGLPVPPLGDLPDPGIEPESPTAQAASLSSEPPGMPYIEYISSPLCYTARPRFLATLCTIVCICQSQTFVRSSPTPAPWQAQVYSLCIGIIDKFIRVIL